MTKAPVAVLGIFVADLAFKAPRLPVMGETLLGQGFKDGPGGKGSNQAIAAARAGADVRIITRIGRDYRYFMEVASQVAPESPTKETKYREWILAALDAGKLT